ncbi:hypothetical protein K2Y00_03855 [Patescibacteria group bacterium]|nr:hypothetical protein [Patescibacteria group bacterium]
MNYHKGFVAVSALLIVLGIIVVGAVGYVALNPNVIQAPTEEAVEEEKKAETGSTVSGDAVITWKFVDTGEKDYIPYTQVFVTVGTKVYDMGEFQGSCSEIGATGGVDGKGLLAGELSAAQCWFAGGGDEIGVFAHEDGGYDIMVGTLEEPIEGSAGFRGNFEVKIPI